MTPATNLDLYLQILNSRSNTHKFGVVHGTKYSKVVELNSEGNPSSAHAFVNSDGEVFKVSNWKTPAKGVRYNLNTDMDDLEKMAGVYTGYLYWRS